MQFLKEWKAENAALKAKLKTEEEKVAQLEKQEKERRRKSGGSAADKVLQSQLEKAEQEVMTLTAALQNMQTCVSESNSVTRDLQTQLAQLRKENESLNQRLSALSQSQ